MYKHLFLIVAVLVGFTSAVPQVNAATPFDEALKRMDAIIVEMQVLRTEFASLASSVTSTPVPAVLGSVSEGILGDDLRFGSTNDDIKKVQTLLATDSSIYPYGVSSGYFGPKTQEAIRMFQSRFDLDTVGVVGPSTRALLEVFFAAYPAGDYPADVLKKPKPVVQQVISAQTTTSTLVSAGTLRSISVSGEDDEYVVRSYKKSGKRNRDLILYPEDGDELVEMIADKLGTSQAEVRSLVDEDDLDFDTNSSSRGDADESDAEDAIDDARQAVYDARSEIRDASDDGDDVDDADELYDEARDVYKDARDAFDDEDYDEAVSLAEEAEELANDAIDEL